MFRNFINYFDFKPILKKIIFIFLYIKIMLEVVSRSTLYSIVATFVSMIGFLIYFYKKNPSYTQELNEIGSEKVFSWRLAMLYSILYSSLIGLFIVALSGVILYLAQKSNN